MTGPLGAEVSGQMVVVAVGSGAGVGRQHSGLVLAGGASGNDPLAATSRRARASSSQRRCDRGPAGCSLGSGGSASTDGGLGALEALDSAGGLGEAEVLVACDVLTSFVDAASQFAPAEGRFAGPGDRAAGAVAGARGPLPVERLGST